MNRANPSIVASFNKRTPVSHAGNAEDFRPDLAGTSRSPYNNAVRVIFVSSFQAEQPPYQCKDAVSIGDGFSSHLRTLQNTFKEEQEARKDAPLAEAKMAQKKQGKRRGARRTTVCSTCTRQACR